MTPETMDALSAIAKMNDRTGELPSDAPPALRNASKPFADRNKSIKEGTPDAFHPLRKEDVAAARKFVEDNQMSTDPTTRLQVQIVIEQLGAALQLPEEMGLPLGKPRRK
jgi:hypothetical protein